MCSVEVREGFPIKASCVHRVDLHSVLADLVLGLRNKDCKKNLTEHKFDSLVEDLLTADLSCHTLFPFSSNYSAVRQSSLGDKPLCTAAGESVCGISVAQNTFSRKCKPCLLWCAQSSQLYSVSETDVPQREGVFFQSFGTTPGLISK